MISMKSIPRDLEFHLVVDYHSSVMTLPPHPPHSPRLSLLGSSEGVEAASQLVDEVFELAYSVVYAHYLEEQAVPYTVSQAKHSLLQIIEASCCTSVVNPPFLCVCVCFMV